MDIFNLNLAYIDLPHEHTVDNNNFNGAPVIKYTFSMYRNNEVPVEIVHQYIVYDSKCVDWDNNSGVASLKVRCVRSKYSLHITCIDNNCLCEII